MNDELRRFASKHGIGSAALRELEEIFAVQTPQVRTMREGDSGTQGALLAPMAYGDFKDRYQDQVFHASGGFSEVFKALDVHIGRIVALKVQRPERNAADDTVRFRREVEITARLQHTGIVPLYDWGHTGDERIWFTMKFVEGDTIAKRIHHLHDQVDRDFVITLRRLLDNFVRLCESVAYGHENDIIHRDIKPDNLMIGKLGEVFVMDWGLARDLRQKNSNVSHLESVGRAHDDDPSGMILRTCVAGTPYYMPPEQANGDIQAMGSPSDVYALGAVLYEILCGKPPYASPGIIREPPLEIIQRVRQDVPIRIGNLTRAEIPRELLAICERAMARAPEHRYPHAGELMVAVRDWLDGAYREERARSIVAEAKQELLPRMIQKRGQVVQLRQQARMLLDRLHSFDKAQDKAEGWKLQDDAAVLEQEVLQEETRYIQKLRSALEEAPRFEEAHMALAEHNKECLLRAEQLRDAAAVTSYTALIEEHQQYLRSEQRTHYKTLLRGEGRLSLETVPSNAHVIIRPYRCVDRSLVLHDQEKRIANTPIRELTLPHGTYLVQLAAPGCRDVAYPVLIERDKHWDGVRPGDDHGYPIHLPRELELGADDMYIPAGSFIVGGDANAGESLPRNRVWVDAFVIRRFPVTNAEFVDFLNRLVADGRANEALAFCPRLSAGTSQEQQPRLAYLQDKQTGHYSLQNPENEATLPVVQVDWVAAMAFAQELSRQTGLPWRLPSELEWEKAARGVDGRTMPWGDQLEPTWACVAGSHKDTQHVTPIDKFPTDVSPYGVRGMAGNVRDWCIDRWHIDGPRTDDGILHVDADWPSDSTQRVFRGSAWISVAETMRLASRYAGPPTTRHGTLGFRLARSYSSIM